MKQDLRILLVEDNRYHATLMERSIAERFPKATIDLTSSGSQALKMVDTAEYDVAILANKLSDLDGLELLELIRERELDLPVVVTALNSFEHLASEAIRSGAAEYVVKEGTYHQSIPRIIGEVYRRNLLVLKNRDLQNKLRQKHQLDSIKVAAGTLSHEINNPLMTILGLSELILGDSKITDQEFIRKVRKIHRSADRIQKTLTRLSNITSPATKETVSGTIIDPRQSRIYTRSQPKSGINTD